MRDIDLTHYPAAGVGLHPAMVICPGGGYWRYGSGGQEDVAEWLNSIGISAFMLKYTLKPADSTMPMVDLQTAIRRVRESPDEWNIDRSKVGVIGFSAGGHLAVTAATATDNEASLMRPDLMVLCYPVISFAEFTHEGTVTNLLGDEPDPALREKFSVQRRVTQQTPPTFLWHTADDPIVPVQNSLMMASALRRNLVPFEMHVFPHGPHATGLAKEYPELSGWTNLCESWLKANGFCEL